LLGLSLLVGVVSGIGAIVFYIACQVVVHYALGHLAGYQPLTPGGEPSLFAETETTLLPGMLLLVPTLGGLLSGLLVYTIAPEAEGHGTDAAIAAYHYHQGRIRPRVPLLKIVSSALTIGTGGSGGREGPIAQIGAGFGSFLGNLLRLRPAERRILMAAGMGAGVAAIFRAPLAGALFAAEVLYRSPDFESEVIIPAGLASVTAYCTFGAVFGWQSLFTIPPDVLQHLTFQQPLELLPYLLLAMFMVVLAMLYTRSFYWLTYLFHQLPIKPHFKPALGAFLTGLLGLALYFLFSTMGHPDPAAPPQTQPKYQVLAVLSFGYGSLQHALSLSPNQASLTAALVLLAIAVGKTLTTGLTIGSGGSGGVFGPSMVIGGCGGAALGIVLQHFWPGPVPPVAAFVVVGMAGFFAAAAKTPVSTLIIVSEMTGNYNLLLPTLWVCVLAFLLADEQSIYHSQVENRSRSPAHQGDYVREVLAGLSVKQFLTSRQEVPVVHPADRLADVIERLSATDYHALPVTDAEGRLLGVVTLEEIHLASVSPNLGSWVVAADLMRTDIEPLKAADRLDRALEVFFENDLLSLPVIDESAERHLLGVVRRDDISTAYLRYIHGKPAQLDMTPAPPPPASLS
jgi:CIC family chloride channel protein